MKTLFELSPEALTQARPLSTWAGGPTELTAAGLAALALGEVPNVAAGSTGAASLGTRLREGGGSTCISCGIGVSGSSAPGFASTEEQRAHFRTDLHRYNVRRRVAGLGPLSEEQFGVLLDSAGALDEVGSLSGSESGSDSEAEVEESGGSGGGSGSGPQFQFRLAGGERCAVWRCLLAPDQQGRSAQLPTDDACLAALRALCSAPSRWAVLLFRGGHFAAAVFEVVPERLAGGRAGQQDKWEALAHKSFHRYVVRAGQGGKQSSKDASGKYARSAGSRLRRHNEAALERDIQEALAAWRELLGGCSLILVHAPASNSQTLFGGEVPLLDKADSRIRRIPFTTRRPTYSETKRVARVLASVYAVEEPQQEHSEEQAHAQPQQQPFAQQHQQEHAAALASEAGEKNPTAPAVAAAGRGAVSAEQEAGADTAAAEAAAAAEAEAAARKKADKRARQKARQKEAKAAESAASRVAAEETARAAAEDEIGRAAAQAAALASRQQPKPAVAAARAGASAAAGNGKASGAALLPRLSAKPRANEDAAVRRARAAAAAEARMQALQAASQQQQLY